MWCLRLTYSIEHFGKDNALRFADEVFHVWEPGGLFIPCLMAKAFFRVASPTAISLTSFILTRQSPRQLLRLCWFLRCQCL